MDALQAQGAVALSALLGWALAVALLVALFVAMLWQRRQQRALLAQVQAQAQTQVTAQVTAQATAQAAAEAALSRALASSQAKSQFLAAASHDLRQPLHAMGLFANALQVRPLDAEAAQLASKLSQSVQALERLFDELLDFSRFESGQIVSRPCAVPLRPLFDRLKLQFEPLAFEKGLALNFRGAQHTAWADPHLLERMLANLLANAVRYTEDGGVIVGCRSRGEMCQIEVWDSGLGIAAAHIPHLFEDFYQVRQGGEPAADIGAPGQQAGDSGVASHGPLNNAARSAWKKPARQGLGLGLAIVQRSAALQGARVQVQSCLGRGTVMRFQLPKPAVTDAANEPPAWRLGPGLAGHHIVLAVADPALAAQLQTWLQAWGAQVSTFNAAALSEGPCEVVPICKPGLVIVGPVPTEPTEAASATGAVHLPGLEPLLQLRQRHRAALPAVVLAQGDGTALRSAAQHHGFLVLTCPLAASKLRALLHFQLLRAQPGPVEALNAALGAENEAFRQHLC